MRWEDIKRYQVIEALLLWEGKLNARQLMDYFETSRPTAQKYISEYKQLNPTGFEFVSHLWARPQLVAGPASRPKKVNK